MGFSPFVSAMAVDERSEPQFRSPRDVAMATNFCFLQFRFHAVTPKRREIGIYRKYRKFCLLSNGVRDCKPALRLTEDNSNVHL